MTWARRHGGAVYLTLLVCFGLAAGFWLSSAAIHRANHANATVTQLCQAGNEARAQQIILWQHLVAVSTRQPPPHETVQARTERLKTARAFIAYVRHVFALRDCQHPATLQRSSPSSAEAPPHGSRPTSTRGDQVLGIVPGVVVAEFVALALQAWAVAVAAAGGPVRAGRRYRGNFAVAAA